MVYQRIGVGRSYKDITESLNVDKSTVLRIVALFGRDWRCAQEEMPPNPGTTKITDLGKLIVLEVVISKPGIYLREVREDLRQTTETDVNESTICRFLNESGFTRQKMKLAAKQRSDLLRLQYTLCMSRQSGVFHICR